MGTSLSPASASTGTLSVTISGLTSGTNANVTLSGPSGYNTNLTSSTSLSLVPGTYSITAGEVSAGSSNYFPVVTTQTFNINAGGTTSEQVNYGNVVPKTTMVLDPTGTQGLSVSSDGNTLTIPSGSSIAAQLVAGNVVAVPSAPAAPGGLLKKVVSLSQNGSEYVVATTPATLADAVTQYDFRLTQTLSLPTGMQSVKFLRPGVKILRQSPKLPQHGTEIPHRLPKLAGRITKSDSTQDPCSGEPVVFTQMINVEIASDSQGNQITATGSFELCPSFEFDFNVSYLPPQLNSMLATVTFGSDANVTVSGRLVSGDFQNQVPIAVLDFDPVVVPPLMLVVIPELTVFVGANGQLEAGFSAGVNQSATVTGGVSYANGQVSQVFPTPTDALTEDPLGIDASFSAKGYVGGTLTLTVDGILAPSFSPDLYLQLNADITQNPWWQLTTGLEGSADVAVTLFGIDQLADFPFPNLFDYSVPLAQASGGFSPAGTAPALNSLNPNMATAGTSVSLAIQGSNFVPGAYASFNGILLNTTYSDPQDLTAVLPGSLLTTSGTYPVTVTNPDTAAAISGPLNITVSGGISTTPAVVFNPSSLSFGNVQTGGTGTTIPVTMQNTGNATLQINQIYISGAQNGNFTESNPCGSSLPAGGSCTISVTFNPTQTGLQSATLNASDNATGSPQSVPLSGTGISSGAPTVTFDPTSLSFGNVQTGGTGTTISVTMQNTGNATLQINQIYISGAQNGNFTESNLCGSSLPAGGSCTISVTFNPTQTGLQSATLNASDNATGSPQSVPLTGTGTSGITVTISPSQVNVPVGGAQTFNATVTGTSNTAVTWSVQEGSGGGTISSAGFGIYFPPTGTGVFHVVATSEQNQAASATATVTVVSSFSLSPVYSFSGTDGANPIGSLVQASNSLLFGATQFGGSDNAGTIFSVGDDGSGFTTVHDFAYSDGAGPFGQLLRGLDGNFYGTTLTGGADGEGTVFQLQSSPPYALTVLHSFSDAGSDGALPAGNLVQTQDGTIFGATETGGVNACPGGNTCGTIFSIDTSLQFQSLYSFSQNVGAFPSGSLVIGSDGNIYGVAQFGGNTNGSCSTGCGTIFKFMPNNPGGTVALYSFSGADGINPGGALLAGQDGNLYGSTVFGGTFNQGVIFKTSLSGSFTALHSFDGLEGSQPAPFMTQAADGNIYSTTVPNGGSGTVFKMDLNGNITVIHFFTGEPDGAVPFSGVIVGSDGNLHGATYQGGASNAGEIYSIDNLFSLDSNTRSRKRETHEGNRSQSKD